MSVYSLYSAPEAASKRSGEERRVLRDGFSWGAMLVPPVWAIAHGLWLELVFWAAGMIALWLISTFIGGEAAFWLYLLSAVLLGFEAAAIRGAALKRTGWRYAGEIVAGAPDLAELAWLERVQEKWDRFSGTEARQIEQTSREANQKPGAPQ